MGGGCNRPRADSRLPTGARWAAAARGADVFSREIWVMEEVLADLIAATDGSESVGVQEQE